MPHRPVGARGVGHVMLACGLHTGPAPPLCWAQLDPDMRACRACRSRRILPSMGGIAEKSVRANGDGPVPFLTVVDRFTQ